MCNVSVVTVPLEFYEYPQSSFHVNLLFKNYFISFLAASNGNVYEVKYKSLKLTNVYPILPVGDTKISKKKKEDSLCCINSISLSENFCATGSQDGYLRLWPLSFKSVYLEAGKWRRLFLTVSFIIFDCSIYTGRVAC